MPDIVETCRELGAPPQISVHNVNDSTTGMRLKERGRAELDSHSNTDVE